MGGDLSSHPAPPARMDGMGCHKHGPGLGGEDKGAREKEDGPVPRSLNLGTSCEAVTGLWCNNDLHKREV